MPDESYAIVANSVVQALLIVLKTLAALGNADFVDVITGTLHCPSILYSPMVVERSESDCERRSRAWFQYDFMALHLLLGFLDI